MDAICQDDAMRRYRTLLGHVEGAVVAYLLVHNECPPKELDVGAAFESMRRLMAAVFYGKAVGTVLWCAAETYVWTALSALLDAYPEVRKLVQTEGP